MTDHCPHVYRSPSVCFSPIPCGHHARTRFKPYVPEIDIDEASPEWCLRPKALPREVGRGGEARHGCAPLRAIASGKNDHVSATFEVECFAPHEPCLECPPLVLEAPSPTHFVLDRIPPSASLPKTRLVVTSPVRILGVWTRGSLCVDGSADCATEQTNGLGGSSEPRFVFSKRQM